MKAFTRYVYGGPEVLKLEEIAKPAPEEENILVKVRANSANPADWRILRGKPFFARFTYGLFKPKYKVLGSDFSGVVVAIGKSVTGFKIGDSVYGSTLLGGAFAEYINVQANSCATMPVNVGFAEMASLPMAGITGLEAIVKYGKLIPGEKVLINGSTGGVGHFVVQIAKAYGAIVTAVCSAANTSFVKELGADEVIAYDKENIHQHVGKYDLIIDVHGNLSYEDFRRMGKRGVAIGFTTMRQMLSLLVKRSMSKLSISLFTADLNRKNLEALSSLVEQKKINPYIQKTYPAQQIPEAIAYIEGMHTKGKVVMTWEGNETGM